MFEQSCANPPPSHPLYTLELQTTKSINLHITSIHQKNYNKASYLIDDHQAPTRKNETLMHKHHHI